MDLIKMENATPKKYDVFIFTECGDSIGYGHLTRCFSLIDELLLLSKDPLLIVNADNEDIGFASKKCDYIIDKWYDNIDKYFNHDDIIRPLSIIDSYLADVEVYEKIFTLSRKALYIDDDCRIAYPEGIIVNPSINASKLPYQRKTGQIYLLGRDYIIIRKDFYKNSSIFDKVLKDKIKDILIIMGGSDIRNLTPKIIKALNSKKYSDFTKHVVIGKGFRNIGEIREDIDNNVKLYYNLDSSALCNLMCSCDFAITAAGQTVYELIATRLPFLCIKVIDNQENNIVGLLEEKIIDEFLNYSADKEYTNQKIAKDLNKVLDRYSSVKMRAEQIEKMKLIDISKGVKNIVEGLFGGI